jgi:hypothetical protein
MDEATISEQLITFYTSCCLAQDGHGDPRYSRHVTLFSFFFSMQVWAITLLDLDEYWQNVLLLNIISNMRGDTRQSATFMLSN